MVTDPAPRVRRAPVPADALLVVRGGLLDPELLRTDVARFSRRYPRWGRTGISAYYACSDREIDAVCQDKLSNFEMVTLVAITDLRRHSMDVVPTFRTPHVTLAAASAESLITGLVRCPQMTRVNPYHA